jgi:T5orf172 domain
MAQRQSRRKREKEAATNIEALTARVALLSMHSNDGQPCVRSETTEGLVRTATPKPLVYENVSSHLHEHEGDLPDGDSTALSKTLPSGTKIESKKTVGDVLSSSMPRISGSDEAHKQRVGESPFVPTSRPTKIPAKSKRSSISPSPNGSYIGVSWPSEPPEQPNEGASSPSAPSLSKSRKRAPRKASSSASKLREVECHVVDLTAESHASSTTVQGSDPVELEHDCGTPANEHVDLSEVKCKEIAPKAETTINAPEEPAVAVTTFENFNERKSCNGVKLEVLRILRREKWEGKLNKALRKALDPNPPPLPFIDKSEGSIYIFKSDIYPGYVKIGKTKQRPEQRITQWEKQCKFTCIHISDHNDKFFLHYGRVEELVQAELWNERRKFKCKKCGSKHKLELGKSEDKGTEHGEWYEISETRALEVVEKWRRLIVQRQPYLKNGILRDFWGWKCRQAMEKKEVDWAKWVLFDWFDIFWYGLYCVHAQLTALSPAITAVAMFPGLFLVVLPISCFILCFFGSRSLIVGAIVGAIAGSAITICMIAFRFLFC